MKGELSNVKSGEGLHQILNIRRVCQTVKIEGELSQMLKVERELYQILNGGGFIRY